MRSGRCRAPPPFYGFKLSRLSGCWQIAATLLFALAALVAVISALSLAFDVQPESSTLGIGVTVIALIIMPVLGWFKRQEARRLNNPALAADAIQSATCAYLAGVTLLGLG